MNKHTILCVDDEIDNVEALERLFRKKFTVLKAVSGAAAMDLLDQNLGRVSVIITDQRMPEMSGVELLEKSLTSNPDAVRILLTGYTDIDSIIGAVNKGQIFRYITKPWDPVDLANTVDRAAERYSLGVELKQKNRELEEALTELQALDKAKSDFMILVNHELKTPITSILSFQALLKETKLDDEQTLMLDRAIKNADRLKDLIDDVLLLMRSENKQLQLNFEKTTIKLVASDIPPPIQQIISQKNITFTVRGKPLTIRGDVQYLRQIIWRLLHNAVKFCDSNTEIILETQDLGDKARIVMQNMGPQIPQQNIDKIMNPFILSENIMNHSFGLGIGLPICQSLLKLHSSALKIKNIDHGVIAFFEIEKASPE